MQKQTITLVRGLGLLAAVSIIIGNVIGTGVFLKARVMTCNVGSPTWVMIAWVAAGILSLAGALTYAELAAMKPEAGGEYIFLRDAFGRLSSFLYGWMLIFVGKTGAQASVAVVFAIGMNDFLDGKLKQTLFETNIFGYHYELTSLQIVAVMMIMIFTTINCASVVLSGQIATVLTVVKIALIAFVGIGAFIWVTGGTFSHFGMIMSTTPQFGPDGVDKLCQGVNESVRYGSASYSFIGGFGAAMLGALWGYDGWNNLSLVAGEIKNPGKNIPLALIGGTILIIFLYVFVHFAYYFVLDPTSIAAVSKDSSVAKEVISKFFGGDIKSFGVGVAVSLFTVGLMLSSIGTLHTSILTGARVPYAMAKDGLMFESIGRLSEGTRVPVYALIFQGVWAALLAISGSFDTLTDYVIFGSWIFYALVTSSVFVFRKRYPNAERPYKSFGYPVVPVLFLLVAAWLLINTMITTPTQSFAGIFLILLGLPVYYYLTAKNKGKKEEINEDVND
jgi:APA family basic amino acid/polyamine antiporter